MAVIQIKTPTVSQDVKTFLSQDYISGATLNVISSVSFDNGNYVLVGEPGLDNSEITHLTMANPTDTTMTVTPMKFSHAKGTPVAYVNWDMFSLEYRISETQAWVVYGSMPQNLMFDAFSTEYRDNLATGGYQWRYRYYSTEKSAYSSYSDIISITGWPRNSVGYMVREIRKIINDPEGKTVSDTEIIRFLNAAQDKIYTLYDRWWFLLKEGTAIPTVASQKTYALPADFGRMGNVLFNYVYGATDETYNLKYISMTEFDYISRDNTAGNDDQLKYYSLYPSDSTSPAGYLRIWPKPATDGFSITPRYFKTFTDLSTYGNTTEVPVPDILENYALSQILKIRKEDDKANAYDSMYREQVELLKLSQRKNASSMRFLWQFQGRNATNRLRGTFNIYDEHSVENYW